MKLQEIKLAAPDANTDLTIKTVVDSANLTWHGSPSSTVWRKSLFRKGGEFGPVTSIVRYDPNSEFRSHPHPKGEEILVMSGVFSDEYGDYAAGTYLLNPEGFVHTPFSRKGCTLFVHLQQYGGSNRHQRLLHTQELLWTETAKGISNKLLYKQPGFPEVVSLQRWDVDTHGLIEASQGFTEIFVLAGELCDDEASYKVGAWVRLPPGNREHSLFSREGCTFYLKQHAELSFGESEND